MKVNFNFCQPKNNIFSLAKIKEPNQQIKSNQKGENKDKLSISAHGKMMSMVETLTQQKESITKTKNELVSSTIKAGGDLKNIKSQLNMYSDQIKNIDQKISDVYAQQALKAQQEIEMNMQKKENDKNGNKTTEQEDVARLSKIANATDDIRHAQTMQSSTDRKKSDIRVKESEVKMGEIEIDKLESKLLTANGPSQGGLVMLIDNQKNVLSNKNEVIYDLKTAVLQPSVIKDKTLNEIINQTKENKDDSNDKVSDNPDEHSDYNAI